MAELTSFYASQSGGGGGMEKTVGVIWGDGSATVTPPAGSRVILAALDTPSSSSATATVQFGSGAVIDLGAFSTNIPVNGFPFGGSKNAPDKITSVYPIVGGVGEACTITASSTTVKWKIIFSEG